MLRASRALMVFLPMSAACAEWPRFANLPPPDAASVAPPPVPETLDEVVESDPEFPDDVVLLTTDTQGSLKGLWQVTRIVGTLHEFGQEGGDKLPYACADSPAPLTYTGDIDWVHVTSAGAPLCLLLETTAADTEWDVLVYAFDADGGCVTGPPLNPLGSTDLPAVTVPGTSTWLGDIPAGALAIYVAGVSGGEGETPYTVHLVPATVAEACESLLVTDIDPELVIR